VTEAAATSGQEHVLRFLDQRSSIGSDKGNCLNISRLYKAAKTRDAAAVRQLVDNSTPVDLRNIRGVTPLWIASAHGHEAVVYVLLATDAVDVNVRSVIGRTPLFWAAANGHSEVVKLLLGGGAGQNYTDEEGRSPVSIAVRAGCTCVLFFSRSVTLIAGRHLFNILIHNTTLLYWCLLGGRFVRYGRASSGAIPARHEVGREHSRPRLTVASPKTSRESCQSCSPAVNFHEFVSTPVRLCVITKRVPLSGSGPLGIHFLRLPC
jgi:hypothetical protein